MEYRHMSMVEQVAELGQNKDTRLQTEGGVLVRKFQRVLNMYEGLSSILADNCVNKPLEWEESEWELVLDKDYTDENIGPGVIKVRFQKERPYGWSVDLFTISPFVINGDQVRFDLPAERFGQHPNWTGTKSTGEENGLPKFPLEHERWTSWGSEDARNDLAVLLPNAEQRISELIDAACNPDLNGSALAEAARALRARLQLEV